MPEAAMMLSTWPRVTLGSARVEHSWALAAHELQESSSGVSAAGHTSDPLHLRHVFSAFPTGVVALAAMVDGQPLGFVANSFVSVSLSPPLVSFCAAHSSGTWPLLRRARRLGISILSSGQEQASRSLATRGVNRFADVDWRATASGAVLLNGSSAWLECSIFKVVRAGDHDIVALRVLDLGSDVATSPLVFHSSSYRRLAP